MEFQLVFNYLHLDFEKKLVRLHLPLFFKAKIKLFFYQPILEITKFMKKIIVLSVLICGLFLATPTIIAQTETKPKKEKKAKTPEADKVAKDAEKEDKKKTKDAKSEAKVKYDEKEVKKKAKDEAKSEKEAAKTKTVTPADSKKDPKTKLTAEEKAAKKADRDAKKADKPVDSKKVADKKPTVKPEPTKAVKKVDKASEKAAAGDDKVFGKDEKSRTIYEGPRGGRYYINSNGNKTYIK